MIELHKPTFYAVAIETYGGLANETVEFIKQIALFAHDNITIYIKNLTTEIAKVAK